MQGKAFLFWLSACAVQGMRRLAWPIWLLLFNTFAKPPHPFCFCSAATTRAVALSAPASAPTPGLESATPAPPTATGECAGWLLKARSHDSVPAQLTSLSLCGCRCDNGTGVCTICKWGFKLDPVKKTVGGGWLPGAATGALHI